MSVYNISRSFFYNVLIANSALFKRSFSRFSTDRQFIFNCGLSYKSKLLDVRLIVHDCYLNEQIRLKYSRKKETKKDVDSDNESDSDDELESIVDKNAKKVTSYLSIPRVDAIVKAGLGIARNKAELLFFENKIRINGYKVPKKSHRVHLGDEVDVIKSATQENNKLIVSRIILTSAKEVDDREELRCKLAVYKTLEIDNYQEHPFKQSTNNQAET